MCRGSVGFICFFSQCAPSLGGSFDRRRPAKFCLQSRACVGLEQQRRASGVRHATPGASSLHPRMYEHIIEKRRQYNAEWQRKSRALKRLHKNQSNLNSGCSNENTVICGGVLQNQELLSTSADFKSIMSAEDFKYASVTFIGNGNTVNVVATSWMNKLETGEYSCYWPTYNQTTRAQNHEIPDKSIWEVRYIKSILFLTDDWEQVKIYCQTAGLTSDIESDNENVYSAKPKKRNADVQYEAAESIVSVKEEFPLPVKRFCACELATDDSPAKVLHPQNPSSSTISDDTRNEPVSSRTAILRTPEPRSLFISEPPERKEENVMTLLQKISSKVDAVMMQQDEIMKALWAITAKASQANGVHENGEPIIIQDLLPQPITQESDLADLNTRLKLDLSFRAKMVEGLSKLGGSDCGGTVRRIMNKIGTNSLWSLYSLKGRKHKIPFLKYLDLYTVILKSCLNTHPQKIKETDVQYQIAETLKHAPNKPDGSRHKR
ncbi:uncharacterized protein [Procambarus clarkii]